MAIETETEQQYYTARCNKTGRPDHDDDVRGSLLWRCLHFRFRNAKYGDDTLTATMIKNDRFPDHQQTDFEFRQF